MISDIGNEVISAYKAETLPAIYASGVQKSCMCQCAILTLAEHNAIARALLKLSHIRDVNIIVAD